MLDILNIILPVFVVIFIGYAFGKMTKMDISPVVDIALYVGVPALVLTTVLDKEIVLLDAGKVWAAALIITFGCGIVAWVVFRILHQKHSGLYLSISIMNTVNIPFPIIYFTYGSQGLLAATLLFIASFMVMLSLGIYIVAGKQWREGIKEVFRIPLIYAFVIGLLLNLSNVTLHELVIKPLNLLGMMAIPLVLLVLGHNLSKVRINSLPTTLLASFLRMGVGLLFGILCVNLLNITGIFRSVVIFESVMPSAVMASVLTAKYNNEAELVASVVFTTTVLSLVIIPFLLYILV
ncbi:AEC family transporter [Chloroflexota bacterium]